MDPPRLKAPLFQMQPRKGETDDRRRVLNLGDRGRVQGDSRDDDDLTVHCTQGTGRRQGQRQDSRVASPSGPSGPSCPSAVAAPRPRMLSLTARRPSFAAAPGGLRKSSLSPLASLTLAPRNQAVLLQVCLILEGDETSISQYHRANIEPVQVWELQNPRRRDAATESRVAISQISRSSASPTGCRSPGVLTHALALGKPAAPKSYPIDAYSDLQYNWPVGNLFLQRHAKSRIKSHDEKHEVSTVNFPNFHLSTPALKYAYQVII
jgi:hypothetical protein